jgi:hypothetical protein
MNKTRLKFTLPQPKAEQLSEFAKQLARFSHNKFPSRTENMQRNMMRTNSEQ